MIVNLYADLVQAGVRALDENTKGIVLVPVKWKEEVRTEVARRQAETIAS